MKPVNAFKCIISNDSRRSAWWVRCEVRVNWSLVLFGILLTVKMSETMAVWTMSKSLTAVNCSFKCEWIALCKMLCCFFLINSVVLLYLFGHWDTRMSECYPMMVLVEINKTFNMALLQYRTKILGVLCNTYIYFPTPSILLPISTSSPWTVEHVTTNATLGLNSYVPPLIDISFLIASSHLPARSSTWKA